MEWKLTKVSLSDFALSLNEFHSLSGLTWSQISRVLGVSERTVRWWATGHAKTPVIHSQRLSRLLKQVVAMSAESPAEARTAILAQRDCGASILQEWMDERRVNDTVIQYSTFDIFKDSLVEDD